MSAETRTCQLWNKDSITAVALTQVGQNGVYRSVPALEQCPEYCNGPIETTVLRPGLLGVFVPYKTIEICPLAEQDNVDVSPHIKPL